MSDPLAITLPEDAATALRDAVAAGEYASVDEALAEVLAVWRRRHEDRAEDLAWVRARIRTSLADPDPDLSEAEVDERLRLMFEKDGLEADEAA